MEAVYLESPAKNIEPLISIIVKNVEKIQKYVYILKRCCENFQRNIPPINSGEIITIQDDVNSLIKSTTLIVKKLLHPYVKLEKIERLKIEKIRNEFHDLVKEYGRLQVTLVAIPKTVHPHRPKVVDEKTPLLQRQVQGHDATNPFEESSPFQRLSDSDTRVQAQERGRQDLSKDLDFERELVAERSYKVGELESIILDVNQIFRDLGYLVKEQGESLDTIEGHVQGTVDEVETGNADLQTASTTYNRKFKRKVCILVFILIIILAIVATLVGLKFKKSPRMTQ